jgi:hypothetical protein
VKPAEFTRPPARLRGCAAEAYLCVYPFVRTPEWYLLSREERGALLAEHGIIGREFPEVLTNTTSAFGLGDWEWILAFEADRADTLVDCIRRLRDAKARTFTKEEIPFVTGIRKSVADALAIATVRIGLWSRRSRQDVGGVVGDVGVEVAGRTHVAIVVLALWELDVGERLGFVWDLREQVGDAVDPCPFLVVGVDDVPRHLGDVGVDEHLVLRA